MPTYLKKPALRRFFIRQPQPACPAGAWMRFQIAHDGCLSSASCAGGTRNSQHRPFQRKRRRYLWHAAHFRGFQQINLLMSSQRSLAARSAANFFNSAAMVRAS